MNHRMTLLAIASVLFLSFAAQANAQAVPPHVEKAIGKIVGEWSCETNVDGQISRWEFSAIPSPNGKCVIYHWTGTDIITGQENSGTGIIGWDAAKQLPYEIDMDADGSVYRSTHRILESGEWTSPTEGTTTVEGKPVHVESYRVFKVKSNDEWMVIEGHRVIGGKPVPDAVSVFKRK